MEWTRQIDGYCERLDPGYWAEPINAISNLAFLLAAFVMWPRVRDMRYAEALVVVLFAIGIGSYLFHTHATVWAVTIDVIPIVIFILLYLFVALHQYWRLPMLWSLVGTALFFPYAYGVVTLLSDVPFFAISAGYWPVALLILAFGIALRLRYPETHGATGRGLILGAAILSLSLTFRSLDELVCDQLPIGTHFLWHILNGVMLGWMIEVYRRHMVAGRAAEG